MSRKKKDTDYVAISARLHALENRMLTKERMEQLLEAREDAEVGKIMADCGYAEPQPLTLANLEESLALAQRDLFADLGKSLEGEEALLDVFRIKHDYHNAKAILKAQARGQDPARLLVSGGRYQGQRLLEDMDKENMGEGYTAAFSQAVAQARTLLAETQDPQQSDFLLDRACYGEILRAAESTKSEFLLGYVRACIDAVNLRCAVRAYRSGNGALLEKALIDGGAVPPRDILARGGQDLAALYRDTALAAAAGLGAELLEPGGGDMTAFERACDDAVTAYVAQARRVPFGVETVIGYLYARLSELTALRIIISGRLAGIETDKIRERLREAYV